jgi:hypothetical protein
MSEAAMKRVKKVPLETMLKNMERFDEEADGLYSKLIGMIENGKPSSKAPRREHLEFFDKVMSLMGKMRECRLDAQRCATDAAPYMHQRLATVQHTVSNDTIKAKPEHDMTRRRAGRLLQQAASAPAQHDAPDHRQRQRRANARGRGVIREVRDTFASPVRTTQSFADSMHIVRSYVLDAQRC